jgi:hypothetical protein
VTLASGADDAAPALATTTSIAPHSASTLAQTWSSATGSVMSAGSTSVAPGHSPALAAS